MVQWLSDPTARVTSIPSWPLAFCAVIGASWQMAVAVSVLVALTSVFPSQRSDDLMMAWMVTVAASPAIAGVVASKQLSVFASEQPELGRHWGRCMILTTAVATVGLEISAHGPPDLTMGTIFELVAGSLFAMVVISSCGFVCWRHLHVSQNGPRREATLFSCGVPHVTRTRFPTSSFATGCIPFVCVVTSLEGRWRAVEAQVLTAYVILVLTTALVAAGSAVVRRGRNSSSWESYLDGFSVGLYLVAHRAVRYSNAPLAYSSCVLIGLGCGAVSHATSGMVRWSVRYISAAKPANPAPDEPQHQHLVLKPSSNCVSTVNHVTAKN
jgi:hypothetical protein